MARSFAVLGWTTRLLTIVGGKILVAEGVHGSQLDDPSELRSIRDAIQRQSDGAGRGSGVVGRAMAAVHGLEELLALGPDQLVLLTLKAEEWDLAIRLQSRLPEDREWRRSLGAKSRRLDAGEAASIAIASGRSLAFASDDEDALVLWEALTGTPGRRTRDLFQQLVEEGLLAERDAASAYRLLQTDDLHNLGGPPWRSRNRDTDVVISGKLAESDGASRRTTVAGPTGCSEPALAERIGYFHPADMSKLALIVNRPAEYGTGVVAHLPRSSLRQHRQR